MREIKFRGLCAISKEMVFGDLIHGVSHKEGQVFILPNKHDLAYAKHCDPLDGVRVIPETVGQFNGRKDKNGREVFDGDLVQTKHQDLAKVIWHNEFTCFCYETIDKEIKGELQFVFNDSEVEIVGNIHENPELITP